MTTVLALLGAKALYLLYGWLASAIVASWLSHRKGYGEKPGLAAGLLLTVVGVLVWLVWPPKADSPWKREGIFPKRSAKGRREMALRGQEESSSEPPSGGAG